ncbi:amidohydrolase [Halostella pelagica]|uniref:amidohydrolase n=1 Tax=Halostella pelagica TaxID=2583824 RepID=UPI00108007A9|nr:amidohydrolase [Halostella pelagica]
MSQQESGDRLVDLRRDLHRHPEQAWREFYTTARIVEAVERVGTDALHVGPDALATDERMGVPDEDAIEAAYERAREAGADEDVLEQLAGGYTGLIAERHLGDGPTVALRVDIDGLPITESTDDATHLPATEGFRSEHEGSMHACGHDAHATIGVGVLDAIADTDFSGTLKVLFQPAEEVVGGGKAMAKSGHLDGVVEQDSTAQQTESDGVDYLFALHVGLDHPTGEVVAGIDGFLAVQHFDVAFAGESAHAGGKPNAGRNANQALAAAVQNLYAIPRHEDGATRVNAGRIEGGTAANIVAEHAEMEVEVRGEKTHLKEYMADHADRVIRAAAEMHDCEVSLETMADAPSAKSDSELVDIVRGVAAKHHDVDRATRRDDLGGSEDATYLMRHVQKQGGLAAYAAIGTDHPGGHHTPTFDVDEATLDIGIDVLTDAIAATAEQRP